MVDFPELDQLWIGYKDKLILNGNDCSFLEKENLIPPQWFLLFDNSEKKFFYSHAGDGAVQADGIYYDTDSSSSKKRLEKAQSIITKLKKEKISKELELFANDLEFGISELSFWLADLDDDSLLILNYAELNTIIHEFTLKNENSVQDLWILFNNLNEKKYEKAASDLKIYKQKWDEISKKASSSEEALIKEPEQEEESLQ